MSSKKIIVTGGAGFIGANIVRRLLTRGDEVHIFVRPKSDLWRLGDVMTDVFKYQGDLCRKEWVVKTLKAIRPSHIINCAAYGTYPFQNDARRILEVNLFGTVNLLAAAEEIGFEKFIHTGSSSEYGSKSRVMFECDRLDPNSPYAVAKAASTLWCIHRGREGNLPIVVLRPFSVYGPWEEPTRLIPTVVLKSLRNETIDLASPVIARDFVYIGDVVDAYIKCLDAKKRNGSVFNIASGKQQTIKIVAESILRLTGSTSRIRYGRFKKRSFDTKRWVGNPSFAKKMLGWKIRTDLLDGLTRTIDWIRQKKDYEKYKRT